MQKSNEELAHFSDLVRLIYEGATDLNCWTSDIVPALSNYFDAPISFLLTYTHKPQDGGYVFVSQAVPENLFETYFSQYIHQDPWAAAAVAKNLTYEGCVTLGDELIPRQEWLQSNLYKGCFQSDANAGQMMAGTVFGSDSTGSIPTALLLYRGLHQPDFCESDRSRLRLILPHLSRSLGVVQRLRSAEMTVATTLRALDHFVSGIVLINRSGEAAFINRSAKELLEEGDGLRLRNDCLTAHDRLAAKAIKAATLDALGCDLLNTSHFSKCVIVPRRSGSIGYTLQFSALGNHNEFGSEYAAIVFINDQARQAAIDPAVLRELYGLTPAEAKVAVLLLELDGADAVANSLGISPNTVRTQIKSIYLKLGVDTRTRFVKTLLVLAGG